MNFIQYIKQAWKNGPSGGTPWSAARLNHMEDGIANNNSMISELNNNISNTGIAVYGSSNNPIDPNTTQEHLVLTNKSVPTSDFWYVVTFFYQNKESNRTQVAVPYNRTDKIYFRIFFDSVWSNWQ